MKIIYKAYLMLVLLVVAVISSLLSAKITGQEIILQSLLLADLSVFVYLLYSVRNSLALLGTLTDSLHQIKNGLYDQISIKTKGEMAPLVNEINSLSTKIKENQSKAKNVEKEKMNFLQ